MRRYQDHFWNDPAQNERLRALWASSLSTCEIGRRMGITKNAVVGKAHRLGLPARESPIIRGGARKPVTPRVGSAVPLPALMSISEQGTGVGQAAAREVQRCTDRGARPEGHAGQQPPERRARAPDEVPAPGAGLAPPPAKIRDNGRRAVADRPAALVEPPACCWPVGDPGEKTFRFCEAPAVSPKPYCKAHCAVAYIRSAA